METDLAGCSTAAFFPTHDYKAEAGTVKVGLTLSPAQFSPTVQERFFRMRQAPSPRCARAQLLREATLCRRRGGASRSPDPRRCRRESPLLPFPRCPTE